MLEDTKKEIMKKFGKKVRMYREMAQLTQEQLAEKCNCSIQTISGTETGYSFPSSTTLFKISEVLDTPLSYLFNFGTDSKINENEAYTIVSSLFSKLDKVQQHVILKVMIELARDNK